MGCDAVAATATVDDVDADGAVGGAAADTAALVTDGADVVAAVDTAADAADCSKLSVPDAAAAAAALCGHNRRILALVADRVVRRPPNGAP